MTWGKARGLSRFTPAKLAYGGTVSPEDEREAFQASLAGGITLFDTAPIYSVGASERRLGELARDTPALIATKFPPGLRATEDDMPGALEASLRRLRRRRVDLYQHHFPGRRVDIPRLMGFMADAVAAGRVRAVGVSNYSPEQMRVASRALAERGLPLASNQVQYSLLHRRPETDGVLETCRELGATLIAYQPLAGGALTGKYLTGPRPVGLRRFLPYFRRSSRDALGPVIALLREIASAHGTGPAQVALAWLVANETVLPIPGAKNQPQAVANAQSLTVRLSGEEIDELDAATRSWRE
jgi:aryl-alcohol dehydrogenase-like predicted oxidoreductase